MSTPIDYPTIEHTVGNTPLIRLQRLPGETSNSALAKLEGNNPAGSVKDRPAMRMINEAESKGVIAPGDTLIEATSGNTGIALAMAAAVKGCRLNLIMPSNQGDERKGAIRAYGAELIDVSPEQGMEGAGVSSGGAIAAALTLSAEVQGATIGAIICDRVDRYLSTGVFA